MKEIIDNRLGYWAVIKWILIADVLSSLMVFLFNGLMSSFSFFVTEAEVLALWQPIMMIQLLSGAAMVSVVLVRELRPAKRGWAMLCAAIPFALLFGIFTFTAMNSANIQHVGLFRAFFAEGNYVQLVFCLLWFPMMYVFALFMTPPQNEKTQKMLSAKNLSLIFIVLAFAFLVIRIWRGYHPLMNDVLDMPQTAFPSIIASLLTAAVAVFFVNRPFKKGPVLHILVYVFGVGILYTAIATLLSLGEGVGYGADAFSANFSAAWTLYITPNITPIQQGSYVPTESWPLVSLLLPLFALKLKESDEMPAYRVLRTVLWTALALFVIECLLRFIPGRESVYRGIYNLGGFDAYRAALVVSGLIFAMCMRFGEGFKKRFAAFFWPVLLVFLLDVARYVFSPTEDLGDVFVYFGYNTVRLAAVLPIILFVLYIGLKIERTKET